MKAESGPWTERVKDQVYMKLLIAGGNMNTNNVMQLRVLPSPTANASNTRGSARLVRTSYGEPQPQPEPQVTPALADAAVTITGIMQGTLGYSQGRGAQALGQVPVVSQNPEPAPSLTPNRRRSDRHSGTGHRHSRRNHNARFRWNPATTSA